MRALCDGNSTTIVEVTQPRHDAIDIRLSGSAAKRHLQTVAAMLGANVDLRDWYRRVRAFPWLARLAGTCAVSSRRVIQNFGKHCATASSSSS